MKNVSPNGMTETTITETKPNRAKAKAKANEEESQRRVADRNLWVAALNESDKQFDKTLDDTSPEAKERLAHRIQKIVHEGQPLGQRWLGMAKDNAILGNAMAVTETTGHIREAMTLGGDVYAGGRWAVGKVMGLFG